MAYKNKADAKAWRERNKEKQSRYMKDYHLKRKYGISQEEYDAMLINQNGGCALCDRTPEEEGRQLAVDHDHTTGKVRGLLCWWCNHKTLGRHSDPSYFRRIADYLEGKND